MPHAVLSEWWHISEVPKFLASSPSKITYAIKLSDPFDAGHLLIILLQLSGTSYFDVYSPSIGEYDELITKIYLTAEEPPWDPSTSEYSQRETQMLDH